MPGAGGEGPAKDSVPDSVTSAQTARFTGAPIGGISRPFDTEMFEQLDSNEHSALVMYDHGVVMVRIEPADFHMGSPQDEEGRGRDEHRHLVKITRPFYVAKTPVTQGTWEAVMRNNPSRNTGPQRPVEMVTWYQALEFCNRFSKSEGLRPAYLIQGTKVLWDREASGFRLLTEAEWEFCARAGEKTAYSGSTDVDAVAWYWKNARAATRPVGRKEPNDWGLYDMSGNVWEWVWDKYGPYPEHGMVTNPLGPGTGATRLGRGGSYYSMAKDVRIACRKCHTKPTDRNHFLGFRICRFPV